MDAYPFPNLLNKLLGHTMVLESDEPMMSEGVHKLFGGDLALLRPTVKKSAKIDERKFEWRKGAYGTHSGSL